MPKFIVNAAKYAVIKAANSIEKNAVYLIDGEISSKGITGDPTRLNSQKCGVNTTASYPVTSIKGYIIINTLQYFLGNTSSLVSNLAIYSDVTSLFYPIVNNFEFWKNSKYTVNGASTLSIPCNENVIIQIYT